MTEVFYRLIFEGEIRPGQDEKTVRKKLCRLLKIDEGQEENLFTGKPVVLRKRVNAEMAYKAKVAFREAGAVLKVEKLKRAAAKTPSGSANGPGDVSTVAVPQKGHARDIPAFVVFGVLCGIFVCLCGYLVWNGFFIKEMETQVKGMVQEAATAVPLLKELVGDSKPVESQKALAPANEPLHKKRAKPKETASPSHTLALSSREKAVRIPVSISREFSPVRMKVSSRSGVHPKLADAPPEYLLKTPGPGGGRRKYGQLLLGTGNNRRYDFILDVTENGRSLLYFDENQNLDLTDDSPLENKGSGIFATVIRIPLRRLIKELQWDGDFEIWFFTNDRLWAKGSSRHYSITQLKGRVTVNGIDYEACIAERGANDADFTNDGIFIDLNHDGKIDPYGEYIPDHGVQNIAGKNYRFDIRW